MKAALLTGVQSVELREVPQPELPEGGLIVKVETCAICGTDVKMYKYGYSAVELPFIPGHEFAGVVAESNVADIGYPEGERVTVNPNIPCGTCFYCQRGLQTACDDLRIIGIHRDGGFARYVMVPALAVRQGCVLHVPEDVSYEEAALIDPVSCAVNAAELSHVKPEDVVVVIGAGPAGCLNVEVSRIFGAKKIILVQRSQQRLDQAVFTGADVYINSSKEDALERVMKETGARGADVVIVAAASGEAQQAAVKMVAKRGNVNLFGGLPKGSASVEIDTNLIHYKEAYVTGTHGGNNRQCKLALDMIASGRIKSGKYISFRKGLSDYIEGLKLAENKKGLKVFIDPDK